MVLENDLLGRGYILEPKFDDGYKVYTKDGISLRLYTRDNDITEGKFETRFGIIKMSIGPFVFPNEHFKTFERGLIKALEKLEEG